MKSTPTLRVNRTPTNGSISQTRIMEMPFSNPASSVADTLKVSLDSVGAMKMTFDDQVVTLPDNTRDRLVQFILDNFEMAMVPKVTLKADY
ncbi:hypothetical protein [Shimia sp.]|uniref:hypothetical protein n=1 Tax=Shimia sp. TaxID=1954381 RepID=UPI003BA9DC83